MRTPPQRVYPGGLFSLLILYFSTLAPTPLSAVAQIPGAPLSKILQLEDLLALSDEQQRMDEEDLAHLQSLLTRPLDLNGSSTADLTRIPILNSARAAQIVRWRDEKGPFQAVADLATVLSLSSVEIEILQLVLIVSPVQEAVSRQRRRRMDFQLIQGYSRRFDLPAGYARDADAGGFEGKPAALYTRLDARLQSVLTFRAALEKDAGEAFEWRPAASRYGFDHTTASLTFTGKRRIRTLVVGDYNLQLGQGLMFWRNTARGKGSQPVDDPLKRNAGIKPTASREENAFFRGAAVALNIGRALDAGAFYSSRTLDATLHPNADSTRFFVGARQTSGLHRTLHEKLRKDAFQERLYGGMLTLNSRQFDLGLSAYNSRFGNPYRAGAAPADAFDFEGTSLAGVEVHSAFRLQHMRAMGAIARSVPGGYAMLAALLWQTHPRFDLILQWRKFQNTYYAFHGNAFAEQNTTVQNESGVYVGGRLEPHPAWTASFYVDAYRHPWLRSTVSRPSQGVESFSEVTFHPRRWIGARMQYRYKGFDKNTTFIDRSGSNTAGRLVTTTAAGHRHSFNLRLDYEFSPRLRLRSRVDWRKEITDSRIDRGTLVLQDVFWSPDSGTHLQLRVSMFNSNGGGATLYAYEHDVRYRFTIQSFTGTGIRNFILLRKRVGTQLTLEVKYGTIRYGRTTNKGAGADSFSGKLVRELNLQFLFHA